MRGGADSRRLEAARVSDSLVLLAESETAESSSWVLRFGAALATKSAGMYGHGVQACVAACCCCGAVVVQGRPPRLEWQVTGGPSRPTRGHRSACDGKESRG